MNETDFVTLSENIFDYIDDYVSDHFDAFDTEKSGNVLTLEHEDGAQIIINRHAANQELWIAAKSGGYHFQYNDGAWLASRDGSEFYAVLSQVLGELLGEKVTVPALQAA
ncbi:iron donor protein CyaY [Vitreoscilla massiliensis]|uniref:Iron-sulfur cluster assembly protein CyaY n=1 Tax=Vitreoscilla massiliensis TaxID=1689272 RepID=A0ABY4E8L2_9NEIS|nr:iron donor protein CyaY [Vitreoscilla massiliensis]UOO91245.1 iron donor protein CyaY [Vitreoscilla massiliensis]